MAALEMDAGIRAQWTAALRSGEYPQGKHSLRSSLGYCCMGVLCDLAVKAGVNVSAIPDAVGRWRYDGEQGVLPLSVQQWAGLDISDPCVRLDPLSELNDTLHWDFARIADAIDGVEALVTA
jgi:hypothetical protein